MAIFFIPTRILWLSIIRARQVPLWNPYYYCGIPLLATLQSCILYPFSILYVIFSFPKGFNLIIILHFFLVGIFTFYYIKELNGSNIAAFIGAITFMFSGYLISIHSLLSHLQSVVWLPLILLTFNRFLKTGLVKYLLYLSFLLLIMFLGGAIEILYMTLFCLFFLVLVPDIFGTDIKVITLKKRAISIFIIIFIFLMLSAVQLLPFLELAFHSIRKSGLSYPEATTWSMELKDILHFFIPEFLTSSKVFKDYWDTQNWLKSVYLGLIPFTLFLYFIIEKKRKSLYLLLLMEISLLFAFGSNSLFYKFLYKCMPFLNKIRYPVKFLFLFIFFISITAGLGYDSFKRLCNNHDSIAKTLSQIILLFSVITIFFWNFLVINKESIYIFLKTCSFLKNCDKIILFSSLHNLIRSLFFASILGPLLILGWHFPRRGNVFSFAITLVLLLDLFYANKGYYYRYETERYLSPSQSITYLKSDNSLFRVFTSPKTQRERITKSKVFSDPIIYDKERITPGLNLKHKIFSLSGSEVIRLQDYEIVLGLIGSSPRPDSTNLLSLTNMKYLISKYSYDSMEFDLVKIVGNPDDPNSSLRIYKNLNCLPRAFLVKTYKVLDSQDDLLKTLQSKEFDPGKTVLLDDVPEFNCKNNLIKQKEGHDKVTIENYKMNSITLSVLSTTPQMLFLSESYYPGWKVYIDGIKDKIYRANFAFRSVPICEGAHRVEFLYQPFSVIFGSLITLFSFIIYLPVLILYGNKTFF